MTHGDSITNNPEARLALRARPATIVINGPEKVGSTSIINNCGLISATQTAILGDRLRTTWSTIPEPARSLAMSTLVRLTTPSQTPATRLVVTGNVDLGDGTNTITTRARSREMSRPVPATIPLRIPAQSAAMSSWRRHQHRHQLRPQLSSDRRRSYHGRRRRTVTNDGTISRRDHVRCRHQLLHEYSLTHQRPARALPSVRVTTRGTNNGTIAGTIAFGDGNNTLTMNDVNATIGGDVTFGSGNDTATNDGSIQGAVNFGEGVGHFTNTNLVGTNVTFGASDDVFDNTGTVGGNVTFGNGNNTLYQYDGDCANVVGNVTFGIGNDTATNGAGADPRHVAFGNGTNTFTNSGQCRRQCQLRYGQRYGLEHRGVNGNVTSRGGNNPSRIAEPSVIGGNVTFGAGDDTVVNAGQIGGNVDGGRGPIRSRRLTAALSAAMSPISHARIPKWRYRPVQRRRHVPEHDDQYAVNLVSHWRREHDHRVDRHLERRHDDHRQRDQQRTARARRSTDGARTGTITITGNYVQSSTGRMAIDFEGGISDAHRRRQRHARGHLGPQRVALADADLVGSQYDPDRDGRHYRCLFSGQHVLDEVLHDRLSAGRDRHSGRP